MVTHGGAIGHRKSLGKEQSSVVPRIRHQRFNNCDVQNRSTPPPYRSTNQSATSTFHIFYLLLPSRGESESSKCSVLASNSNTNRHILERELQRSDQHARSLELRIEKITKSHPRDKWIGYEFPANILARLKQNTGSMYYGPHAKYGTIDYPPLAQGRLLLVGASVTTTRRDTQCPAPDLTNMVGGIVCQGN